MNLADLYQEEGHVLRIHLLGSYELETAIPRVDRCLLLKELTNQGQVGNPALGQEPRKVWDRSFPLRGPHHETSATPAVGLCFQASGSNSLGESFKLVLHGRIALWMLDIRLYLVPPMAVKQPIDCWNGGVMLQPFHQG